MTNASPSTTVAATTAPSSENTGPSPPGPNCSASPPARLPRSFMSVSMRRRRAGLHSRRPPKVVGRRKEIIAQSANAPFAAGAKSADGTPSPRRAGRPGAVFPPWFSGLRAGERRALAAINDVDIRSAARSAPHLDVYRLLSASIGLCRRIWQWRLKAAHKYAVNASLPIGKLSGAPFATIFHVSNIDW